MKRTKATPTTAAARTITRLRGARIVHGAESVPVPERSLAKARNWAVLADGSCSGVGMG